MHPIIELILITFVPTLELRASIPYGIITGMNLWEVFFVCVVANIILGILVYLFIEQIVNLVTRIKPVKKFYLKTVENTQKKISKVIDKYGEIGVAFFIGIPIPGSGVYTAALGSYLLGIKFRKFLVADIIGVIIAGIIVTILVLGWKSVFSFIIN